MRKTKKRIAFVPVFVAALAMGVVFQSRAVTTSPNQGNKQEKTSPQTQRNQPADQSAVQPGNAVQTEEKNKVKNQGENTQIQTEEKTKQAAGSKNTGQVSADTHRSAVATFVKNLLEVAKNEDSADKNGIGSQVRSVAMEQNQGETKTITAMESVQTRSRIKTFFIGSDFKNLGEMRSEMVQTQNRIRQLTGLMEKTENEDSKQKLQVQISEFEAEQAEISQFITDSEDKFSLFGWVVKMFQ